MPEFENPQPFRVGERIWAGCDGCQKLVEATLDYGDIRLDDGTEVSHILRATCDFCGLLVGIPQLSVPAIKAARDERDRKRDQAFS